MQDESALKDDLSRAMHLIGESSDRLARAHEFLFDGGKDTDVEIALQEAHENTAESVQLIGKIEANFMDAGYESAELKNAKKLLPAWFVPRMMSDEWQFGLLLTTGDILCISTINEVRQAADGAVWLDVEMLDGASYEPEESRFLVAPISSRLTASVNAA